MIEKTNRINDESFYYTVVSMRVYDVLQMSGWRKSIEKVHIQNSEKKIFL